MKRRGKGLSREDLMLWALVAETVKPMPGRSAVPMPVMEARLPQKPALDPVSVPKLAKTIPQPTPLQPLEDQLLRRLSRGRTEIDARLDLHGLRQDEAFRRLRTFLLAEQGRGSRVLLVITGKGKSQATDFRDVGVLKRQVPQWLSAPDLRQIVVGFDEAARHHGGEGALYVRLRRSRS